MSPSAPLRRLTNMLSPQRNQPPSLYPKPWPYLIILTTAISTTISTGILAYFTYYLRVDNMSAPSSFVFLLSTSSLTLLLTIYNLTTHLRTNTSPKQSFILHSTLLALALTGLIWLSAKLGHMVLSHSCAIAMWQTDMGMMVCRIYKALYAFIVISTLSIGANAVMDYVVMREEGRRGVYREMKDSGSSAEMKKGEMSMGHGGLRRGFYTSSNMEMQDSPDLSGGKEGEDDGQRLIRESPEMGADIGQFTPYTTPKL